MANMYIGINGVAKKIKEIYIGVDGVAKKVKRVLTCVDNEIARLVFGTIKLVMDKLGIDIYGNDSILELLNINIYRKDKINSNNRIYCITRTRIQQSQDSRYLTNDRTSVAFTIPFLTNFYEPRMHVKKNGDFLFGLTANDTTHCVTAGDDLTFTYREVTSKYNARILEVGSKIGRLGGNTKTIVLHDDDFNEEIITPTGVSSFTDAEPFGDGFVFVYMRALYIMDANFTKTSSVSVHGDNARSIRYNGKKILFLGRDDSGSYSQILNEDLTLTTQSEERRYTGYDMQKLGDNLFARAYDDSISTMFDKDFVKTLRDTNNTYFESMRFSEKDNELLYLGTSTGVDSIRFSYQ